jgi:hypothetical protein
MKKFFITLFVLIILAALVVFFGWAQMGVPPDAYGVIRSKSHGIDSNLVSPGEFRWVWYKLIPTNVKTTIFRIKPVNHEFFAKDTLPSGTVYQSFAGIGDTFAWEIRAGFSFALKPEALVELVTDHNIDSQEELGRYESDLARQMEAFILRSVNSDGDFAGHIEALLRNGESPEFEREILNAFPMLADFALWVKSAVVPDFALYRQLKELYENDIVLRKAHLENELEEKAQKRVESQLRYDELEQYGILLTKYPILLEYLALESGVR